MRELSNLTTAKLSDMFTIELATEYDVDAESTYANSKIAIEILRRGKEAILDIGKYLSSLEKTMPNFKKEEMECIKDGWILLYCDIAFNGERPSTLKDFNELVKISGNYVPLPVWNN